MIKKTLSTLLVSSVLLAGFSVSLSEIALAKNGNNGGGNNGGGPISNDPPYTLTLDPKCNIAAAVFDPDYTDCSGAYLLGNGENDVTNGQADNIVNQLLNNNPGLFGDGDWTFLAKDDGKGTTFFDVTGIGQTSGTIEFDVDAIENSVLFDPEFIENYDIAISFKAAKNFSIYYWQAPLNSTTISWTTDGTATNDQDIAQGLSHASVYLRRRDDEGGGGNPTETPEPSTVLGLTAFLGGAAVLRRRRSS
jgi:hypothetical protein